MYQNLERQWTRIALILYSVPCLGLDCRTLRPLCLSGIWTAVAAAVDRGLTVKDAAELGLLQKGELLLWVHAARVHVLSSSTRETEVRLRLSEQEISYALASVNWGSLRSTAGGWRPCHACLACGVA